MLSNDFIVQIDKAQRKQIKRTLHKRPKVCYKKQEEQAWQGAWKEGSGVLRQVKIDFRMRARIEFYSNVPNWARLMCMGKATSGGKGTDRETDARMDVQTEWTYGRHNLCGQTEQRANWLAAGSRRMRHILRPHGKLNTTTTTTTYPETRAGVRLLPG